MAPIFDGVDKNYVAYIRDAQKGILINGQYVFYRKGSLVAQGSYEEMNDIVHKRSILDLFKKPLLLKDLIHVDLKEANTHNLEYLEKILESHKKNKQKR